MTEKRFQNMQKIILHERFQKDTIEVVDLTLCRVLLMKDSTFPWLILVPMRPDVTEIHQLSKEDRAALMEEMTAASKAISRAFCPDKINVGALGNLVPQLHIHVIGRKKTDRAWPGPVWGSGPAVPYSAEELEKTLSIVRTTLKEEFASE